MFVGISTYSMKIGIGIVDWCLAGFVLRWVGRLNLFCFVLESWFRKWYLDRTGIFNCSEEKTWDFRPLQRYAMYQKSKDVTYWYFMTSRYIRLPLAVHKIFTWLPNLQGWFNYFTVTIWSPGCNKDKTLHIQRETCTLQLKKQGDAVSDVTCHWRHWRDPCLETLVVVVVYLLPSHWLHLLCQGEF